MLLCYIDGKREKMVVVLQLEGNYNEKKNEGRADTDCFDHLAYSPQCQYPLPKPCLLFIKKIQEVRLFKETFDKYCIIFYNTVTVFLLKVAGVRK